MSEPQTKRKPTCNTSPKPKLGVPPAQGCEESQQKQSLRSEIDERSLRIDILVRINEGDQLDPSFIDYFSKYILNTTRMRLDESLLNGERTISYEELFDNLKALHQRTENIKKKLIWEQFLQYSFDSGMKGKSKGLISNLRKGSADSVPLQINATYRFTFKYFENSIILVLDLSPYMTIFEYSTKNFPIMVLQDIIRNLIKVGLLKHYKSQSTQTKYYLTVYCFSTFTGEVIEIIYEQEVVLETELGQKKNKDEIVDYILSFLNKSRLPHNNQGTDQKVSIGAIIQKVLNLDETSSRLNSIIIISTFKNYEEDPRIFFNYNLVTFSFVCIGQLNFGSFFIDKSEIKKRYFFNPSFMAKFVFSTEYVDNWKMLEVMQKSQSEWGSQEDPLIKQGKNRTVFYCLDHEKKDSIFEQALHLQLQIEPRSKYYQKSFIGKNSPDVKTLAKEKFTVPEEWVGDIMKTKYLQGWQQVHKEQTINTRFKFKIEFAGQRKIFYQLNLEGDHYKVVIKEQGKTGGSLMTNEEKKGEKVELTEMVKIIDMINTSSFEVVRSSQTPGNSRRNIKFFSMDACFQEKINLLEFILNHHKEWNKFFKTKTFYIEFKGTLNADSLAEFLEKISSFLGMQIENYFFIKRCPVNPDKDKTRCKEARKCKIIFTKISRLMNLIEIKCGFLRYRDNEINFYMRDLNEKIMGVKLKKNGIFPVPQDIHKFCRNGFQTQNGSEFSTSWVFKLREHKVYRMFKISNRSIMQKLGYEILGFKTYVQRQSISYFYKIILYRVSARKTRKKAIFLTMTCSPEQFTINCRVSAFPEFTTVFQQSVKVSPAAEPADAGKESVGGVGESASGGKESTGDVEENLGDGKESVENCSSKCFPEVFKVLVGELEESQMKFLKSMQNYFNIHQKLLKKRISEGTSGHFSERLMREINCLHRISRNQWFESNYIKELNYTLKKLYGKASQQATPGLGMPINPLAINIDHLIEPNKLLMNSKITTIRGDICIKSRKQQKQFIFFLLTPYRCVYIWKKPESTAIFYRCIPPMARELSQPTEEDTKVLEEIFKEELTLRIEKQEQYEKYLWYYTLISTGKMPAETAESDNLQDQLSEPVRLKSILEQKSLKNVSSFLPTFKQAAQKLNKSEFLDKIAVQELKMDNYLKNNFDLGKIREIYEEKKSIKIENSMKKVIQQFSEKVFEFVNIFFAKSEEEIAFENWKKNKELMKLLSNWTNLSSDAKGSFSNESVTDSFREQIDITSEANPTKEETTSQKEEENEKIKCYYFQRKDVTQNEEYSIKASKSSEQFNYIVLKILNGEDEPLHKNNILEFLLKTHDVESPFSKKPRKSIIRIYAYGCSLKKGSSKKIQWLVNIIESLIQECELRLKMMQVTKHSEIPDLERQIEEKHNSMINYHQFRIPDILCSKKDVMIYYFVLAESITFIDLKDLKQGQSHEKFLAVELEENKSQKVTEEGKVWNYGVYYWLSVEISPTKFLKTKMVEFKYLKYSIGLFSKERMSKSQSYSEYLKKIIDEFTDELIKFFNAKKMLEKIQKDMKVPIDPISTYSKKNIKRRIVPKKFSKAGNLPPLHPDTDDIAQGTDSQLARNNIFDIPFIYANFIPFIPIFGENEILDEFSYFQRNSFSTIVNLYYTYIFENNKIKDHLIFELEEVSYESMFESKKNEVNTAGCSAALNPKNEQLEKRKKKKKAIKYRVFCLNRLANREIIEKMQGSLFRQAFNQITFTRMSKILEDNEYNLSEELEEYLQMGNNFTITIPIPFITQKFNLRQYFRQHLELFFFHHKFKLKNRHLEGTEEVQVATHKSFNANQNIPTPPSYKKASVCTSIISKKLEEEIDTDNAENRCERANWMFSSNNKHVNAVNNLRQAVGDCLYLVKFEIVDQYATVDNARIWERETEPGFFKSYIYGDEWHSNSSPESYCEKDRVMNYLTYNNPKMQPTPKSPIRLQSLITEQNNQSFLELEIFSSFGFPNLKNLEELYANFVLASLSDYYFENCIFDIIFTVFKIRTHESFQILQRPNQKQSSAEAASKDQDSFGSPRKDSEELLFKGQEELNPPNIIQQAAPLKKKSQSSPERIPSEKPEMFDKNMVFRMLLNLFLTMGDSLPKQQQISSFTYKTVNELYIEQPILVLKNILITMVQVFSLSKGAPKILPLPCIIYGVQAETKSLFFWDFNLKVENGSNGADTINEEINMIREETESKSIKSFGFFFLDSLFEIKEMNELMILEGHIIGENEKKGGEREAYSITTHFPGLEQAEIDYRWVKHSLEKKSFCQGEFLFKRSLGFHFEVWETGFNIFAYNFKFCSEGFKAMKKQAKEFEYWYSEKLRFFNFIKGVKVQRGKLFPCEIAGYETLKEPFTVPSKTISIETVEQNNILLIKEMIEKKNKSSGGAVSPTLPTQNTKVCPQEKQAHLTALAKQIVLNKEPPIDFAEKRNFLDQMYFILSASELDYDRFPEYDGQENSKLQKIGIEYLSILRAEYGVQKGRSSIRRSEERRSIQINQGFNYGEPLSSGQGREGRSLRYPHWQETEREEQMEQFD